MISVAITNLSPSTPSINPTMRILARWLRYIPFLRRPSAVEVLLDSQTGIGAFPNEVQAVDDLLRNHMGGFEPTYAELYRLFLALYVQTVRASGSDAGAWATQLTRQHGIPTEVAQAFANKLVRC